MNVQTLSRPWEKNTANNSAGVIDEHVGASRESLADGLADDERQVRDAEDVAQGLAGARARDGAGQLEIGRGGDRRREAAADPSGRAGEADADASRLR